MFSAELGKLLQKRANDIFTIAGPVVTAAGALTNIVTTPVKLPRPMNALELILHVTAAATEVGDTLDVAVETLMNGDSAVAAGTLGWVKCCAFTQVLGDGGVKMYVAKLLCNTAEAMFEASAALAAGSVRHIFGDSWRVKYTQVDANANASFTFSVYGLPL